MSWRAGILHWSLAACLAVLALPTAALAEDDPLIGRWSVTGESSDYIIEMTSEGSGRFVGAVSEKPDDSTLCWAVGDPVIHVSGSNGNYLGTAQLYEGDCSVKSQLARVHIEIDPGSSNARVTYTPPDTGCTGCEPEIWNRAPPASTPLWLLIPAAVLGAAILLTVILLAVLLRPKARARRRAGKQSQLTGNVSFRPRPAAWAAPAVRTPAVPGISIRLQPRFETGEPVVPEETPR